MLPIPRLAAFACALVATCVAGAAAAGSCNYTPGQMLGATPLPGPGLLYRPAPTAAILQSNDARFVAEPLMVAGHEKYDRGEYLYQDYIFDDFGAETTGAPFSGSTITSPASGTATPDAANFRTGDVSYPSNQARYGNNAADLVELRIAPGAADVAYRVTLNTLFEKDSTLVGIAWNRDAVTTGGSSTLIPTGATTIAQGSHGSMGATVPGTDEVIWLWNNTTGGGGQHVSFNATGVGTVTSLTVTVDVASNQMTVLVPRAVHNPTGSWKYVVMTGLHNGSGTWLLPGQNASATAMGGAGDASPNPPAILDLNNHYAIANGQTGKTGELCHYLDTPCDTVQAIGLRQVNGLTAPALTPFARAVDFDKLAAGTVSTSLPAEGAANPDKKSLVRIFNSRIVTSPAEGRVRGADEGNASAMGTGLGGAPGNDKVLFYGPLQMYSVYVPTGYRSATPAPLTWSNHSLAQFHSQYNGTAFIQEAGEKRGSLVATPNSRSAEGFYVGRNEIDHFEVWADLLRRYNIDPSLSTMTGYSMGGYAAYRLTSLYPDLFARTYTVVGPAGAGIWNGANGVGDANNPNGTFDTLTNYWLENVRNVPFFNQAVTTDYLVPIDGSRQQNIGGVDNTGEAQSFEKLGYRYTYEEFSSGEHLTLFINDAYPFVKNFLGTSQINSNPVHVTFSYVPASDYTLPAASTSDNTAITLSHDHAYWVSGLKLRNAVASTLPPSFKAAKGTIDAFSYAFGLADPVANAQTTAPGTLTGGHASPALAYTEYAKTWQNPVAQPMANRLALKLTNLSAVQVDMARASLTAGQDLQVDTTSDGATQLDLLGAVPSGSTVLEDGAPLCAAQTGPAGLRIPVKSGSHSYTLKLPQLPAPFSFVERINVPLSYVVTSEPITLAGFSGDLDITPGPGMQYRINNGPFTNAPGSIKAGDVLTVRHVSAAQEGTVNETSISIGGFTTTLKTTTTTLDHVPAAFDFGLQDGQTGGVKSESLAIIPTAYDDAPISAGPGAEYRINSGTWRSTVSTIKAGDSVQARHVASSQSLGYAKSYIKIGGVVGYYTSRTKK